MFVLFYGPCCLIQINDDDDDDDDDEFTDLLDHRVCLVDRKPYGNWRRRCRRHRVQVRRAWRRHHHAEVQRRREARHEAWRHRAGLQHDHRRRRPAARVEYQLHWLPAHRTGQLVTASVTTTIRRRTTVERPELRHVRKICASGSILRVAL